MTAAPAFHHTIAALEATGDYRVLRRFVPRERYNEEPWNLGDRSTAKLAVFVDCETTGLDTERDEIIELSLLPFTYDAVTGIIYDVHPAVTYLEEPRRPLSPEIVALTGITPEVVAGQRIDDDDASQFADGAGLIIAHNAAFDRPMIERRLPAFALCHWACSQREVPWAQFGAPGQSLVGILMSVCGEFTDGAHRAAEDCAIGVHLLATAEHDGRTALSYLLESARAGVYRVCAMKAPREAIAALKARGYRAQYTNGEFQYWYRDMAPADVGAEQAWCSQQAFATPVLKKISAKDRWSVRA